MPTDAPPFDPDAFLASVTPKFAPLLKAVEGPIACLGVLRIPRGFVLLGGRLQITFTAEGETNEAAYMTAYAAFLTYLKAEGACKLDAHQAALQALVDGMGHLYAEEPTSAEPAPPKPALGQTGRQNLIDAIWNSYPLLHHLDSLCILALGASVYKLAKNADSRTSYVDDVIDWAYAHDKLPVLLAQAYKEHPESAKLWGASKAWPVLPPAV